ncbi:helix-turn-helix transcriptional regulator [Streptomyces sp. NPDC052051]|uniref:helix-turn-helix domain-containing protein n=1 Tax=Streptomyces sp. NPDC052051 TaxID=3154649 RepID=UPI0034485BBE
MGSKPRVLESTGSEQAWFGAQVRRLRTEARLSQAALGARVHCSVDQDRWAEADERFPSRQLVEARDREFAAGGVLLRRSYVVGGLDGPS